MKHHLEFLVRGSAREPYLVTFDRDGRNLTAECTCAAGLNGTYCKHRFNLIAGISKGLVSDNLDEVPEVGEMCRGTDVHAALERVLAAEADRYATAGEIAQWKKALSRAMHD